MSWSVRIAVINGIDIKIHFSFLAVLGLAALLWGRLYGLPGAFFGLLLMTGLFLSVGLHELGHSLVARRFALPVREIVLLPIGGVSIFGRTPQQPYQEVVIAGMGPVVNLILAGLLFVVLSLLGIRPQLNLNSFLAGQALVPSLATLLTWLFTANLSLAVFNLLPAFPLDGGHALRAGLETYISFPRATRIAVRLGQLIAVAIGLFGMIVGDVLPILVAAFMFFGAHEERTELQVHLTLETVCVGDAYNKHAVCLSTSDRLSTVVTYLLTSYQPDFAVMQGTALVGIVTRDKVLQALLSVQPDVIVTDIMHREIIRVPHRASLQDARRIMQEQNVEVVAVYDGNAYLGLVSLDDLGEALAVITYLQNQEQLGTTKQPQINGVS